MDTIDKIMTDIRATTNNKMWDTIYNILEKHLPKEEVAEEFTRCERCDTFYKEWSSFVCIKCWWCTTQIPREFRLINKSEPKKIEPIELYNNWILNYTHEEAIVVISKINEIILHLNNMITCDWTISQNQNNVSDAENLSSTSRSTVTKTAPIVTETKNSTKKTEQKDYKSLSSGDSTIQIATDY